MDSATSPVSRILLLAAFFAVASSAGLQWAGLSAQAEASRQQASRHTLAEFSTLLTQLDHAPEAEKPAVAAHLNGVAEQLEREAKGDPIASASRRLVALASFETAQDAREKELQERLRAEVRGLANVAESMQSSALGRAEWLGTINAILLGLAAVLCGTVAVQSRRVRSEA